MIHGKWTIMPFVISCLVFLFGNQVQAQTNVALNKPAYVSSWDTAGIGANGKGLAGALAVDGDPGTRWATDWINDVNRDSGWIYIDLQAQYSIDSIVIIWETAGALHYAIQVANCADPLSQDTLNLLATDSPWTTAAEITNGASGETRTISFPPTLASQVRVRGYSRTTTFGYSIWELQCFSPALSAHEVASKLPSTSRTVATPSLIRFFAPDITGCRLYDVRGRCLAEVNQQAGPTLTLAAPGAAGFANNVMIARLASKNGISMQRLTIAR